jgi:hypothetical protein
MENVNLLNINPNEWTLVGFRSYKTGVLEWDVHREFAERMFGKPRLDYMEKKDLFHNYVKLAERDAIWLFHRRVPGTSTFDLIVLPKKSTKPAKPNHAGPIRVIVPADDEDAA